MGDRLTDAETGPAIWDLDAVLRAKREEIGRLKNRDPARLTDAEVEEMRLRLEEHYPNSIMARLFADRASLVAEIEELKKEIRSLLLVEKATRNLMDTWCGDEVTIETEGPRAVFCIEAVALLQSALETRSA